jgi:hypothetical protein
VSPHSRIRRKGRSRVQWPVSHNRASLLPAEVVIAHILAPGTRSCAGPSYEDRPDEFDKPSIAYWRDHSAGASRRRVTPIPQGNRPSTAACTSLGARKASETVILTCRMLQFSRCVDYGRRPSQRWSSKGHLRTSPPSGDCRRFMD